MRALVVAALVAAGVAPAGLATAPPWTAKGKVTRLTARSITVHGTTCAITKASPGRSLLRLYFVGADAKIACVKGVLRAIDVRQSLPGVTLTSPATTVSRGAPAVQTSAPAAQTTSSEGLVAAGGASSGVPITALADGSITVGSGKVTLTCAIGPDSPSLGGLQVGDRVHDMRCRNSVLASITPAA